MPASTPRPGDENALHELFDRFCRQNPGGHNVGFHARATKTCDVAADEATIRAAEQHADSTFWPRGSSGPQPTSHPSRRDVEGDADPATSTPAQSLAAEHGTGSVRLTRFITCGGMGQVWQAYDEELPYSVAYEASALAGSPQRAVSNHNSRLHQLTTERLP